MVSIAEDPETTRENQHMLDIMSAYGSQHLTVQPDNPSSLKNLRLRSHSTAKIVPGRIFSLTFLPTTDRLLILVRITSLSPIYIFLIILKQNILLIFLLAGEISFILVVLFVLPSPLFLILLLLHFLLVLSILFLIVEPFPKAVTNFRFLVSFFATKFTVII